MARHAAITGGYTTSDMPQTVTDGAVTRVRWVGPRPPAATGGRAAWIVQPGQRRLDHRLARRGGDAFCACVGVHGYRQHPVQPAHADELRPLLRGVPVPPLVLPGPPDGRPDPDV